jgi:glycine betaine/choline ABC-type transport system substrate-binding protein
MEDEIQVGLGLLHRAQVLAKNPNRTPSEVQQALSMAKAARELLPHSDEVPLREISVLISELEGANDSAETLFAQAILLHDRVRHDDHAAAAQLKEVGQAAIDVYAKSDPAKVVQLKAFVADAIAILPPENLKELLDRIQIAVFRAIFPAKRQRRVLFYYVVAALTCGILVLSFRDKLPSINISFEKPVTVGGMDFEEQRILGELVAQFLERRKVQVRRVFNQTQATLEAGVEDGSVDVYVEYSGAPYYLRFHQDHPAPASVVYRFLSERYAKLGVILSKPFPFQNEWAVYINSDSELNHISTVSQLAVFSQQHPLLAGWPSDFRHDPKAGSDALMGYYGLKVSGREIEMSELYGALKSHLIQIAVGNSTDGETLQGWLIQLADDRQFFPPYEPIILARRNTYDRTKGFEDLFVKLPEKLSFDDMRRLNLLAKQPGMQVSDLIRSWLDAHGL